jgi:hypothetical protein
VEKEKLHAEGKPIATFSMTSTTPSQVGGTDEEDGVQGDPATGSGGVMDINRTRILQKVQS